MIDFAICVSRILAGLLFSLPVGWLLIGAMLPEHSVIVSLWDSPDRHFSMQNFRTVTALIPVGQFILNSLRVVAIGVPFSLLSASLAGFAMIRLSKPAAQALVALSILALLSPPTALWLARFPIYKTVGWLDSPLALIAPALLGGSPFFVLIFYRGFSRISLEQIEASQLDGATYWRIWWSIALPACRTTVLVVAVLSFLLFWNNFSDPLLYLRSENQFTLPVGLQLLAQLDSTRWPVLLAGAVLLAVPPLFLLLLLQGGSGAAALQSEISSRPKLSRR